MRLFLRYLRSKRRTLFASFGMLLLLCVSFALYHLPLAAVIYPMALCALLGLCFLLADYHRVRSLHETLSALLQQTAEALEELPEPDSIPGEDYRLLAEKLRAEALADRDAAELRYRETVDYYTVWAHQIKTPIAAMKLTLQQEDSAEARMLRIDLRRIEQYVEMVLAYLRLEPGSSDYVFREVKLDDVIRPILRKFGPEFIGRRLQLRYTPIEVKVLTDEKWLGFVIEQLLSNALKYTREGSVAISLREPLTLCVEDTGIGIAPEDLPRIFDRGYTGYNGRKDRSASGIGLYLCRRICRNLGAEIRAESEVGKGTVISVALPKERLKAE